FRSRPGRPIAQARWRLRPPPGTMYTNVGIQKAHAARMLPCATSQPDVRARDAERSGRMSGRLQITGTIIFATLYVIFQPVSARLPASSSAASSEPARESEFIAHGAEVSLETPARGIREMLRKSIIEFTGDAGIANHAVAALHIRDPRVVF